MIRKYLMSFNVVAVFSVATLTAISCQTASSTQVQNKIDPNLQERVVNFDSDTINFDQAGLEKLNSEWQKFHAFSEVFQERYMKIINSDNYKQATTITQKQILFQNITKGLGPIDIVFKKHSFLEEIKVVANQTFTEELSKKFERIIALSKSEFKGKGFLLAPKPNSMILSPYWVMGEKIEIKAEFDSSKIAFDQTGLDKLNQAWFNLYGFAENYAQNKKKIVNSSVYKATIDQTTKNQLLDATLLTNHDFLISFSDGIQKQSLAISHNQKYSEKLDLEITSLVTKISKHFEKRGFSLGLKPLNTTYAPIWEMSANQMLEANFDAAEINLADYRKYQQVRDLLNQEWQKLYSFGEGFYQKYTTIIRDKSYLAATNDAQRTLLLKNVFKGLGPITLKFTDAQQKTESITIKTDQIYTKAVGDKLMLLMDNIYNYFKEHGFAPSGSTRSGYLNVFWTTRTAFQLMLNFDAKKIQLNQTSLEQLNNKWLKLYSFGEIFYERIQKVEQSTKYKVANTLAARNLIWKTAFFGLGGISLILNDEKGKVSLMVPNVASYTQAKIADIKAIIKRIEQSFERSGFEQVAKPQNGYLAPNWKIRQAQVVSVKFDRATMTKTSDGLAKLNLKWQKLQNYLEQIYQKEKTIRNSNAYVNAKSQIEKDLLLKNLLYHLGGIDASYKNTTTTKNLKITINQTYNATLKRSIDQFRAFVITELKSKGYKQVAVPKNMLLAPTWTLQTTAGVVATIDTTQITTNQTGLDKLNLEWQKIYNFIERFNQKNDAILRSVAFKNAASDVVKETLLKDAFKGLGAFKLIFGDGVTTQTTTIVSDEIYKVAKAKEIDLLMQRVYNYFEANGFEHVMRADNTFATPLWTLRTVVKTHASFDARVITNDQIGLNKLNHEWQKLYNFIEGFWQKNKAVFESDLFKKASDDAKKEELLKDAFKNLGEITLTFINMDGQEVSETIKDGQSFTMKALWNFQLVGDKIMDYFKQNGFEQVTKAENNILPPAWAITNQKTINVLFDDDAINLDATGLHKLNLEWQKTFLYFENFAKNYRTITQSNAYKAAKTDAERTIVLGKCFEGLGAINITFKYYGEVETIKIVKDQTYTMAWGHKLQDLVRKIRDYFANRGFMETGQYEETYLKPLWKIRPIKDDEQLKLMFDIREMQYKPDNVSGLNLNWQKLYQYYEAYMQKSKMIKATKRYQNAHTVAQKRAVLDGLFIGLGGLHLFIRTQSETRNVYILNRTKYAYTQANALERIVADIQHQIMMQGFKRVGKPAHSHLSPGFEYRADIKTELKIDAFKIKADQTGLAILNHEWQKFYYYYERFVDRSIDIILTKEFQSGTEESRARLLNRAFHGLGDLTLTFLHDKKYETLIILNNQTYTLYLGKKLKELKAEIVAYFSERGFRPVGLGGRTEIRPFWELS